jgi:hypothetical protein
MLSVYEGAAGLEPDALGGGAAVGAVVSRAGSSAGATSGAAGAAPQSCDVEARGRPGLGGEVIGRSCAGKQYADPPMRPRARQC